jgi:hypothetical protein
MMASAQTGQSKNSAAKGPGSGAPAEPDESVFTVHKTVSEVHLVFTVTDKHGHYVEDLKKNDFKILDDPQATGRGPKLQQRDGSALASRPADRCQRIGEQSLQV